MADEVILSRVNFCSSCSLEKENAKLKEEISMLLSCANCPENKGGYICEKEYNDKCLAQKIEYIKELKDENAELSNSILEFSNSEIELTNSKTELENKVTELEKQIKKMKSENNSCPDVMCEDCNKECELKKILGENN